MFQDVVPFIMKPSLSSLYLLCSLMLFHPRPVLILVVFLYNCHYFRRSLLTPSRKTASSGLFKGIKLSHFLLETVVVLLEFSQLATQRILLLSGALVDPLDEELVIQSQPRLRH